MQHLWVLLNVLAADSKAKNKQKKFVRTTENELGPIRISRKPDFRCVFNYIGASLNYICRLQGSYCRPTLVLTETDSPLRQKFVFLIHFAKCSSTLHTRNHSKQKIFLRRIHSVGGSLPSHGRGSAAINFSCWLQLSQVRKQRRWELAVWEQVSIMCGSRWCVQSEPTTCSVAPHRDSHPIHTVLINASGMPRHWDRGFACVRTF